MRDETYIIAGKWHNAMAFIPVVDCAQLTAVYTDDSGIVAINRHYFGTEGTPDSTILTALAAGYVDWLTENYLPALTTNWKLTEVIVRDMSIEAGEEVVYTTGLPLAGTNSSTLTPNQVSYTVTWLTGFVGRSFRGRTYGIGIPYSYSEPTGRQITTVAQSALQAAWDAFLTVMSAAGGTLEVVSFFEGGVPRTTGQKTIVAAPRVNFPLATQRRRLR